MRSIDDLNRTIWTRTSVPLQPRAPHTLTAQPLLQRECEGSAGATGVWLCGFCRRSGRPWPCHMAARCTNSRI
jgi:hypothetical protein